MELRQLRYFVSVVDAGSITRACDSLHVVQSAVSHQLRLLEEEIGCALLVRSAAGVTPTPAGTVLYRDARGILKQVADAKLSASFEDSRVAGSVAIGMASSTARMCAMPILAAIRRAYPEVMLSIHEGLSSRLTGSLIAGRLDLVVVYASEATAKVQTTFIAREPFYFATTDPAAKQAYAGRSELDLAELARWPLLLPSTPNGTRSALDRACARENIRYDTVAEINTPSTQCASVLAGLGSTVLPWVSLNLIEHSSEVLILPLVNPRVYRDVVVAQATTVPSRAADAVKALVIETVSRLHEGLAGAAAVPER